MLTRSPVQLAAQVFPVTPSPPVSHTPLSLRVTVIIPALNEREKIARAVTSAWALQPHEVLVVDGGSRDETCALAAAAGARVLSALPGRALQQNVGAREATGDVLLFLHADTWLDATGVEQIRAALADPTVLGGCFRQAIAAPGVIYRLLEQGNALRVRWRGIPYGDQGIFLRRETFEQLGGFPETQLLEDLLLMRRLRQRAWPVLLPGPLGVSPRRWQKHGPVRQTCRNWLILLAARLGVAPDRLAQFYRRHDDHSTSQH